MRVGRSIAESLRRVSVMALVRVSAWTGAWTGMRGTSSVAYAFTASTRGVGAGQASAADERASHNLQVAGSSPAAAVVTLYRVMTRHLPPGRLAAT
jgi:hypothetical protein